MVLAHEPGQSLGGLPADIEHGGVGDAGQRVKPLAVRNLIFADLFLLGLHPYLTPGHPARSASTARIATVTLPGRIQWFPASYELATRQVALAFLSLASRSSVFTDRGLRRLRKMVAE
ncbi:hypothetical protein [Streptomyces sp. 12257]|uniref:hypothetical protein n=1 Tax=Streptomyces sp. 12257 TaxID=3041009 RepID=UPI000AF4AE15|nr:hypothetical protein [Streptomyces sp. 12257]MDI5904755.1 hypothetical protein [Streptomyces sp. 12257]